MTCPDTSPRALLVWLAAIVLASGCARSRLASGGDIVRDAATPNAGSVAEPPAVAGAGAAWDADNGVDAGAGGHAGTTGPVSEPPISAPDAPPAEGFPRAPRVRELLDTLLEPSFNRDAEAVAEEHCGHVLQLVETARAGERVDDVVTTQRRVLDAEGRLLLADTESDDLGHVQRLQIDYDDQGRVERWRRGPLGVDEVAGGSVVELSHEADGSIGMEMVSTEIGGVLRDTPPLATVGSGFCERSELDADGRLLRTSFGCDGDEREARVFHYDDQGRLEAIEGRRVADFSSVYLDDRFVEPESWRIEWTYEGDLVTTVWNEVEQFGEDEPREVEQRIVRTFDADGLLLKLELDRGNDGSFDEQVVYTYDPEGEIERETRDFMRDGIIDYVYERVADGSSVRIERRNMAQHGDERVFSYSLGYYGHESVVFEHAELIDARQPGGPQSVARWVLDHDAEGRLVSGSLDLISIDIMLPPPSTASVSSTLEQRHSAAGFVEYARVEERQQPSGLQGAIETRCSLESFCGAVDVVPAEQSSLLACQTAVMLGASSLLATPYAAPPYLPPPYDRIEAIRRRQRHERSFEPRPPSIRELVGY